MIVRIFELAGKERVLTGSRSGRALFSELVAAVQAPSHGRQPCFLDFEEIEVVTSSYLRESVLAFRDYVRSMLPNLYPVFANMSEAVEEELTFFLNHRKDAVWACRLRLDQSITEVRVLGELEEALKSTLSLVQEKSSVSAPALAANNSEDNPISTTAWNNRLAALSARGLIIEGRVGKTKIFKPVLEIENGIRFHS